MDFLITVIIVIAIVVFAVKFVTAVVEAIASVFAVAVLMVILYLVFATSDDPRVAEVERMTEKTVLTVEKAVPTMEISGNSLIRSSANVLKSY